MTMEHNETKPFDSMGGQDTEAGRKMSSTQEDDEMLARLGHVQELRRNFSIWSLGGLCLCLMATWEALSTVVAQALVSGGAPCLFYNYVLSFIATVSIAASMAEIASIYPTAGGQYHWVAALSPASSRSAAAWFSGWISIGGQIVLTASAAFAAGLQTQALIILNSDSYLPQRYQGMLFYFAILLYAAMINIWGVKLLPLSNSWAGALHVTGFVAIIVVLGVMSPKNDAEFVFVEFTNRSGWPNDGISWLVGLLSTVYPMLGYDAACHIAEEIPHAARNVPLVMVGSVTLNGLMGLIYCIILLFCTGPLGALLSSPTGFPFMQIYLNATKSHAGATIMSLILIAIATVAAAAGTTSTSRTLWAFARDNATPFSGYFSKVNDVHQVPVRAIGVVVVLQMLLGFIYLGNTTAFFAVLAMAIIGMYLSYILPIIYMLIYGRPKMSRSEFGPFYLGKPLGIALNVISIIWLAVCIIFSTFPTVMPVTPQNMNYSSVVMAGWLLFGAIYYFTGGWKKFDVPVVGEHVATAAVHVPNEKL